MFVGKNLPSFAAGIFSNETRNTDECVKEETLFIAMLCSWNFSLSPDAGITGISCSL